MNINKFWEDHDPISKHQYKHVFWQSILLVVICMGTYTSIGLASNWFVLVLGIVLLFLLMYLMLKFQFNLIKHKLIEKTYLLYALIAASISLAIYWSISAIIGQPNNQMDVYNDLNTFPLYVSIIIFVILGPIFEELIFRGFILKGMFKGHLLLGLIVSSTLFGLVHGPASFGEFTIYLALGLIFGGLYLITNRIETAMICHGLNNLVHIIIFLAFYN
ncbi:CPBP family intramembrane glutamic endopeptidase [Mammaliicoccus vitulinus]|uniref:CPBP family intramembrane glutamic endopeptidase n=1 Tax=Mammaliicoccus vitulinus TaxID=71237 RepID=UPI003BA03373